MSSTASSSSENKDNNEDNNVVVDANKFKAGDVRQSVGRFWRVVIDADAKFKGKTNFRYCVPLE